MSRSSFHNHGLLPLVLFILTAASSFAAPPTISTQPQSQTISAGATLTLTVVAAGPPAPSYQWKKGGSNIAGATSSTYSKTNAQAGDAGDYTVYVSNNQGNLTSNVATITVNVAPSITTQPQSQSASIGANVTFTVAATGTPAPTFQWKKDGSNISGATSTSLSRANIQVADGGGYSVFVSNSDGNVTSSTATLTVKVAPAITTQPQSQTVAAGGTANFSITSTGTPTPTYQWKKGGVDIAGATSATFSKTNVQQADAGDYTVFLSNSEGNATSNIASLTVNVSPTISTQPQSQSVAVGGTANFTVVASGTPAPTYQWKKDGSNISGATNSSYSKSNIQTTDAGNYTVVVSNSAGNVTSNTASLSVIGPIPPAAGAIAGGEGHTMLLKADGTVWGAGDNSMGQLGDGTLTQRFGPVQVSGLTAVAAIAAGRQYTMALKTDGTVWGWGDNYYELQGLGSNVGTTTYRSSPVLVSSISDVKAIAAKYAHTLALKNDGTVYGWGDNYYGAVGTGTSGNYITSPAPVSGLTGVTSIAAGWNYSLALRNDGTVWSWGINSSGELGDGTTTQRAFPAQIPGLTGIVAISAGVSKSLALKNDGTVWMWGIDEIIAITSPVQVAINNIIGIDVYYNNIAIKNDGSVWSWGDNRYGGLCDGTSDNRAAPVQIAGLGGNVVSIMASQACAALKNDGTVWSWGTNSSGQFGNGSSLYNLTPVQTRLDSDVTTVAAYGRHSAAVRSDGTVRTWGQNGWGELGDGTTVSKILPVSVPGLSNILSVAVGGSHTLALKADGTVYAWGSNTSGELGDGSGLDRAVPGTVSGLTNITAIAAGNLHSFALRNDGAIYAWGSNYYGSLGDGTNTTRLTPTLVNISGVTKLFTTGSTVFAVKADGSVWGWGNNTWGVLGDGSTIHRNSPVQITGISNTVGMDSSYHTIAVKSDGSVWSWGANFAGELGDGTTTGRLSPGQVLGLSNVTTASAALWSSLIRKGDGTVWSWGSFSALGLDAAAMQSTPAQILELSSIVHVHAASEYGIAYREDGTVWAWGLNAGQWGLNPIPSIPVAMAVRLIPSSVDTDQDGLLDSWEIQHFGNLSHNGATDSDGDGLTDIQEYNKGSSPISVNADGDLYNDFADTYPNDPYNGQVPSLTILGGNNQSAAINQFNAQPFDVAVWNNAGTLPLVGVPVQFAVTQGGGSLAVTKTGSPSLFTAGTLLTDVDGTAQVFYKQPATAGVQSQVTVSAGPATPVVFQSTSINNGPDSDGDGMLDAWEMQYFGNLNQTANGDFDGDGVSNYVEFLLGRNPTKAALADTGAFINLRLFSPAR